MTSRVRSGLCALLVVSVMSSLGSVAASTAGGATDDPGMTYIFRGAKRIGDVWVSVPHKYWDIECAAYDGATIALRPGRIEVDSALLDEEGYGKRVRDGQWVFYGSSTKGVGTWLGVANRRSASRWDVQRGRNKTYGHTSGPDGAEAAAALLILWGRGAM